MDWNRYAYTRYNSIRYIDPSGHCVGILAGIDTVICIDAVIVIGLTAAALAVANPEGAEAAVELIIDGIENATDTVVYLWESTAGTVLEARISKRTLGALNQVANHLSKLNQGASVGGFPGFEPPKGDDDYNKKIEEGNFNAQDVNDWIKDINKHPKAEILNPTTG